MGTTEYFLHSLTEMDRYVRLVAASTGAEGIVNVVSDYLAAWPKDWIESLQKVDGGWGPFDDDQQPVQIRTVADVSRICDSVSRQCSALKEARVAPNSELLELDLFFFFVRQVIEDHVPVKLRTYAAAPESGSYNHWSDPQRPGVSF